MNRSLYSLAFLATWRFNPNFLASLLPCALAFCYSYSLAFLCVPLRLCGSNSFAFLSVFASLRLCVLLFCLSVFSLCSLCLCGKTHLHFRRHTPSLPPNVTQRRTHGSHPPRLCHFSAALPHFCRHKMSLQRIHGSFPPPISAEYLRLRVILESAVCNIKSLLELGVLCEASCGWRLGGLTLLPFLCVLCLGS